MTLLFWRLLLLLVEGGLLVALFAREDEARFLDFATTVVCSARSSAEAGGEAATIVGRLTFAGSVSGKPAAKAIADVDTVVLVGLLIVNPAQE